MLLEYKQDNDLYTAAGLAILALSFIVLSSPRRRRCSSTLDARRWAGYFCLLCGLACVKSVLALAFGHIAVPRLVVTDRRLVFELLCLLDGISILTFRLVTTPEIGSASSSSAGRGARTRLGHLNRARHPAIDHLICGICHIVVHLAASGTN